MRFRNGWLLKTVAIAAIAWMAGNAAVAQSDAQNFSGGSTIKVNCYGTKVSRNLRRIDVAKGIACS
jgi:hypothetical protein